MRKDNVYIQVQLSFGALKPGMPLKSARMVMGSNVFIPEQNIYILCVFFLFCQDILATPRCSKINPHMSSDHTRPIDLHSFFFFFHTPTVRMSICHRTAGHLQLHLPVFLDLSSQVPRLQLTQTVEASCFVSHTLQQHISAGLLRLCCLPSPLLSVT